MEEQQLNGSNVSTGVKKKYNKKPAVTEDKAQPPQQDILETQPKGNNKHQHLNVSVRSGDVLLEFDDITVRVGRSTTTVCNKQ